MTAVVANSLYTAAQSRAIDRAAIEVYELPGALLMARAARSAFSVLLARWPQARKVRVICGPGNNGGDGLLLALLARDRGLHTQVYLVAGEPRSVDARRAAERARGAGLSLREFDTKLFADADADADAGQGQVVIVDAILGTGISGIVREAYARAIDAVNASPAVVLSLDVPSGIDSDTGAVQGRAVRAAATVSFISAKRGLYTAQGPVHAGDLFLDDLDVPQEAFDAAGEACARLQLATEKRYLPLRSPASHKGHFGRCLLIGGDRGMGGAIVLAGEAALRTGVGLARVATRAEHLAPLLARRPELMVSAVDGYNDLPPLLDWADTLVVGPGLGLAPWGEQMLQASLASGKPLLLDADALNLLAGSSSLQLPGGSIITPHPGEAARLLGVSSEVVQADRFAAALELAARTGAAVVLKGNGSIVAAGDGFSLCSAGNPGMASGGMGDVLSGIIGALMAQGLAPAQAARLGTVLHSSAADRAAERVGELSLLAADVLGELAPALR
jgi:hydroxyethylthiazole kinase-like uncharacterized protein yjeF